MTTKDDLLALMLRECDICIHLHGKVPAGKMEFRLTPPQRSTLELLRYLAMIGIGATESMLAGSWEPYERRETEVEAMDAASFPAAMERQKAALVALFGGLGEDDLRKRTFKMPWGKEETLFAAITSLAYASLVAYRMQLFLHAKASGNAAIGTANCWGGMDAPPKG